ncbi:MAG TPA: hypothetical protein VM469_04565 [Pseudoxanthomonas sp.]|nr:hypothetical protein [Pseudoxanthomonas sp.]
MSLEDSPRLSAALADAQSAINQAAERELQRRAGQITALSGGSITPSPAQNESIYQAAASELQERFAEQVESLATAFRVSLSQQ